MKKIVLQNKELGNIESSLNYFLKFNVKNNAKILDIGCNYGSLVYNLYKKGYKNVYGIDVNKESISNGKEAYKGIKNKISLYDGKKIPYKDQSFDVVLMFDVIEHIPNIKKFLKEEVYRVLKNKGIYIFQTPNKITNIPWEIINNKSLLSWKKYHCSLQTLGNLNRLLKQLNFKDIKIEKYNINTNHNKNKIKDKLGLFGIILLKLIAVMPLKLQSNFWGSGIK